MQLGPRQAKAAFSRGQGDEAAGLVASEERAWDVHSGSGQGPARGHSGAGEGPGLGRAGCGTAPEGRGMARRGVGRMLTAPGWEPGLLGVWAAGEGR